MTVARVDAPQLGDELYRLAPVAMWVYDEETLRFLSVNEAAIERYGYSREEFLAMTILDIRPPEDRAPLLEVLSRVDRSSVLSTAGSGWRHVRRDGAVLEIEVANSERIAYAGRPAILTAVFDVTERAREAERVAADRTALAEAHRTVDLGSFILDLRKGHFRLYGRLVEIYGRSILTLDEAEPEALARVHPDDAEEMRRLLRTLEACEPWEGELRMMVDGEPRWLSGRTRLLREPDGTVFAIVCVCCDVTDRKGEEERLRRIAFTDPATKLPNRAALCEAVAIPAAVAGTLLLVRTDPGWEAWYRPHEVKGRNAAAIAAKLAGLVPRDATLARYADDTFAVLIPPGTRRRVPLALARRIVEAFDEPLPVGGCDEIVLRTSVGIGWSREPVPFDELSRRAGVALGVAREADVSCAVYDELAELRQVRRTTIDRQLRHAIADRRIGVVYQPVVAVASGRIVGAEALMRWSCPGIGPVPPSEFVEIAEENGQIVRLGEWVLREAAAQARRWQIAGHGALRMAVNVSARQVAQRDFVRLVTSVCEQTGLLPLQLELEVTERLMLDRGIGVRNLEALRRLGVRVSVDDFGTGYSSLSCLGTIPLDVVKIDRSFVAPIADDPFQALVAENVILLAHERGLHVIGEGVEYAEQFHELQRMGCDDVQGYLFGKPMAAEEFAALLERQRGDAERLVAAG